MSPGLVQETQPFDDPIVQVDQLSFRKAINVDFGCHRSSHLSDERQNVPLGLR